MTRFNSLSDDFYININLNTEMDLPDSRETILHFFEQLQKSYPSMRNFYSRDNSDYVLEEDKDRGHYRWATIESRRICSGYVNPSFMQQALDQHRLVLELVPFTLSLSSLDCESLNVMFGFDFTYRGNHNQLVVDALGVLPCMEPLLEMPNTNVIAHEPTLQFALDEDCRTQCRVGIETRTTAYHVKTATFPEEQLSVYVTGRRFGSLDAGETYVSVANRLANICCEVIDTYVGPKILKPLQQTIGISGN